MNDIDHQVDDETACPACKKPFIHYSFCPELGCDGGVIDEYEDDAINYGPGSFTTCRECGGAGFIYWCPGCGANITFSGEVADVKGARL